MLAWRKYDRSMVRLAEQDRSWQTGKKMLRNGSKSNQAQKPRILLKERKEGRRLAPSNEDKGPMCPTTI